MCEVEKIIEEKMLVSAPGTRKFGEQEEGDGHEILRNKVWALEGERERKQGGSSFQKPSLRVNWIGDLRDSGP